MSAPVTEVKPADTGGGSKRKQAVATAAKTRSEPAHPMTESERWMQLIAEASRDPAVDTVKMKELFAMSMEARRMSAEDEAKRAERAFNAAMARAQAALEPVVRNVENKHTKSNYANLAAIAEAAMGVVHENGFGISFDEFESAKANCLGVLALLTHDGGHSRTYRFNVPMDGVGAKGNSNMNPTHAYGSTLSYGRRYAECAIFNIATEDDDGNKAGGGSKLVSAEEAESLTAAAATVDANMDAFYQYFGIEHMEDMPADKYERAMDLLKQKAAKKI